MKNHKHTSQWDIRLTTDDNGINTQIRWRIFTLGLFHVQLPGTHLTNQNIASAITCVKNAQ